ncbi:MAG: phosphoglycerate dehydrogenase [Proteobacteria bacterium]|nr:phosphoglycerate dehydrogenase [Pseudomonadota bacterium]
MDHRLSFPKEKIKVVLLEGIHQSAVDYLHRSGYTNVVHHARALPLDELRAELATAYLVGIRSRTQLTADVLADTERLFAVGCFCIGTNQVDLDAAGQQGIPVFNAPHSNTRSVAELVIAESIMLLRGLGDKNGAAHRGGWQKSARQSYELRSKTMGIVGYGHIGSQVSILAEALGMRVIYHDIVPRLAMGNAQQLGSLTELLTEADIVTLHVPQDPSTHNLINRDRLAEMRPGSYLINASRGTVVDVDALADAVRSGHVAGAAVDVFPREPKSNDETFESPLRGLPNVILTPHIGGSTVEAQRNIGQEVASKLVNYSDQGTTMSAVNFPQLSLSAHKDAHRLLHIHHNQPGVLAAVNRVLTGSEANILGQHLQTDPQLGYVVTDVDREHADNLRGDLLAIPGTIRCRILY